MLNPAVKYMSTLLQWERSDRNREGERTKGGNIGGREGTQRKRRKGGRK